MTRWGTVAPGTTGPSAPGENATRVAVVAACPFQPVGGPGIRQTGRFRRGGRALAEAMAVAAAALVLAGCGGSGSVSSGPAAVAGASPSAVVAIPSAPAGTAGVDLGDLRVRGAYIPAQASASEAAAYFTVTNVGSVADTLIAVTTPAASMVSLHTTVTHGGAEAMAPLSRLVVPAHGTTALTVGHNHLMLINPVRRLTKGQRVTLTLSFVRAGQVDLAVPVLGFTGPDDAPTRTPMDMNGMTDMPGMSMH